MRTRTAYLRLAPSRHQEVSITMTFRPVDLLGLTEVVIDPEPLDQQALLELLEQAQQRLHVYCAAYAEAADADGRTPVPL